MRSPGFSHSYCLSRMNSQRKKGKKNGVTERQKRNEILNDKDQVSLSRSTERDSESCECDRGEKARCQRGHSNSEERRTQQGLVTGPTGPPLSTSLHSHTHRAHARTHSRLANGPPSCPIRNCLISCAKQPLPCQPWCHLLSNNMAADQTSTHKRTHAKRTKTHSKDSYLALPRCCHIGTHIKPHRHRCSPKVSTLRTRTHTHTDLIARPLTSQDTSCTEDAHTMTRTKLCRGCACACVW